MKKKEIGQCKDCKWFGDRSTAKGNPYNGVCELGNPGSNHSNVYQVDKYFGCWYWKERK